MYLIVSAVLWLLIPFLYPANINTTLLLYAFLVIRVRASLDTKPHPSMFTPLFKRPFFF